MKQSIWSMILVLVFAGCENHNEGNQKNTPLQSAEKLPYLTFQQQQLFPGNSSLLRPEDGVALADGRVVVSDLVKGLRLIEKDGSNRAFGNFADVGFLHNPPEADASPNGIFLENDKQHILVCDVGDGKIFRVNIATEKAELVYDHPFGVNAIYRDKAGALWFTQSDNNPDMNDAAGDPDFRLPNGAIFRMTDLKSKPALIADSLYYANGITMDADERKLYVAETMMNRVLSFDVDVKIGEAKPSGVAAIVIAPDNIMVDREGRLIIASPGSNQVIAVNFKNHSQQVIFDASTPETRRITNEWYLNSHLQLPRARLITSKMHGPLPGLLTGMFFSQDGRTLYITNLGKDILRMDFK